MAILGRKKEEKVEEVKKTEKTVEAKASAKKETKKAEEKKPFHVAKRKGRRQTTTSRYSTNLSRVLVRPRITEKASDVSAQGTYVFEVATDATKTDVRNAVKEYYKVTPIKVNLVKIPTKKRVNRRTRKIGVSSQGKKAYVFLKKGDSIEFV